MLNEIILENASNCPICKKKIDTVQTKKLNSMFEEYRTKDCVAHAEDIKIIKNKLFCNSCSRHIKRDIYLVVYRGILIGITDTLKEARSHLRTFNLEKIILWYHDLYQRYKDICNEKNSYKIFLNDLNDIYGNYSDEILNGDSLRMIRNLKYLNGSGTPIKAIKKFLIYKDLIKVLNVIWAGGREELQISCSETEIIDSNKWSVKVSQDEINCRCGLDWTWVVMSDNKLKRQENVKSLQPDWIIVVDTVFSKDTIISSISKWLSQRGFEFNVRMNE